MTPSRARHACEACRRLKRKCNKELPSCSLCIRLGKVCDYSNPSSSRATEAAGLYPLFEDPGCSFPSSFFMDAHLFTPLNTTNALTRGPTSRLRLITSEHLAIEERGALHEEYFTSMHQWLPMISEKRLLDAHLALNDACHDLLLLCMKLCIIRVDKSPPSQHPLYCLAKYLSSSAENEGLASLRLIQALVLLAVYELSHAIHPAAYLTIGRAARLVILIGWHDRDAQQLFKPADTWSLLEEQRRTWWSVFILDRVINTETSGLPFATPEPSPDELLPVNDEDWGRGKSIPSQPLYTASFSTYAPLGCFARTCQAAHMLGKVINNRDAKQRSSQEAAALLTEAQGLHQALAALKLSIEQTAGYESGESEYPLWSAIAICVSAQSHLYSSYGCPDAPGTASRARLALDTEMQGLSVEGLRVLASSTGPRLAQIPTQCPLMARCFYAAATACAWFIREDGEPEMRDALRQMVSSLTVLSTRWAIAGEYLALLEQSGTLNLIDTEPIMVDAFSQ
ncbi:Fungal-trans domain-containing protein [Fusarium falciforme]|uniref:Fungal-trans domain-containing protein n=1 Tax=Fusarium falciforme TaxID=195108 RepID=UPI0023011B97|nr:Fungal-trans domain-containing protein [Fusarium falciforme]WAO87105.1 Fungal-trans domain-containing protein [Fusarium falciforme]